MGCYSGITVTIPYLHQIIINNVFLNNENLSLFLGYVVFMILLYLLQVVFLIAKDYLSALIEENIQFVLKRKLNEQISMQYYKQFINGGIEKSVSRYNIDVKNIADHFSTTFLGIGEQIITLVFTSIMILRIDYYATIGELTALLEYQGLLIAPFYFFGEFNNSYQEVIGSIQRMTEVFDSQKENLISGIQLEDVKKIQFLNVNFEYDDGHKVLLNANFEVHKGDIVGITGMSGSGKTTFINLLLRLYDTKSGEIMINDIHINNINLINLSLQIKSQ